MLGEKVPIVAPFDHHANITQRMVDNLDGLVGHRTQPHDPYDTGRLAAKLLFSILSGSVHPTMAWRKIPMLTHQEQFLTSSGPMQIWFERARAMEQQADVLSVSTFPMQCWLDVPEGGWASVVITGNDADLAQRLSTQLATLAWQLRDQFWVYDSIAPADAVRRAVTAEKGLVILSDTGDSVFGGATGDSTVLLQEMLRQNVTAPALVPMVDPEVVALAYDSGVGSRIEAQLGGKLDPLFGQPVQVAADVVDLKEGMLQADVIGRTSFDMGRTALLNSGSIQIVVSEHVGVGGNHPIVYRRFGIDPSTAKMVVLKTASNFQYYREMASEIIRVDTPGPTMSHLERFPWQHVPRPIYPLDDLPDWKANASSGP